MSDTTDFSSRVNEISEQLQSAVGEAIERWARDGRNQLRSAVGAPDQSAIMGAFVLGAAIGALVGAIVALLVAPKSGSELRDEIAERASRTDGMSVRETPEPVS